MKTKYTFPLVIFCVVSPATVIAQQNQQLEFDAEEFQNSVNEAISDLPGVTFETDNAIFEKPVGMMQSPDYVERWKANVLQDPPQYGFVVVDQSGAPLDVLSGDVPFQAIDGQITIPGYDLKSGSTVNTVGSAQWIEAVEQIQQSWLTSAPSEDIARAVQSVRGASGYIAEQLCELQYRPTEIVLNLDAGFKLVFNIETGSKITWDLEVVCSR